jgi:hypothetical protein
MRKEIVCAVLATLGLLIVAAAVLFPDHGPPTIRSAEAAPPADLTACHIKGSMRVDFDPDHPTRVAKVSIGPNCETTESIVELNPDEFNKLAQAGVTSGASSPDEAAPEAVTSNVNKAHATVSFWHNVSPFGEVREFSITSWITWFWDGSYVNDYCCGYALVDPAGCGWYASDGPYQWYTDYSWPYGIDSWGWAYMESSCDPGLYWAWGEPTVWGDYQGWYGAYCDYDGVMPGNTNIYCNYYLDY